MAAAVAVLWCGGVSVIVEELLAYGEAFENVSIMDCRGHGRWRRAVLVAGLSRVLVVPPLSNSLLSLRKKAAYPASDMEDCRPIRPIPFVWQP